MLVVLLIVILSIPSIVGGMVGLLRYRPWARILTIVLSLLSVLNIPFGTALGVYGLWVMLQPETTQLFGVTRACRTRRATSAASQITVIRSADRAEGTSGARGLAGTI